MSTEVGRLRLQQLLADEVDRRGKTWVGLGDDLDGDSSASTIRSYVQSGVARRPHRKTLAVIDRMLGWEPGRSQSITPPSLPVRRVHPSGLNCSIVVSGPVGRDNPIGRPQAASHSRTWSSWLTVA